MSLRNKLALLFFAITAASFGAVYFIVVPQLQSKLEDQQMEDLRADRGGVGGAARGPRWSPAT